MNHRLPAGTRNEECLSAGGDERQFQAAGNYFDKKPLTRDIFKIGVSSFDAFIQIGVNIFFYPLFGFVFEFARPLPSVPLCCGVVRR